MTNNYGNVFCKTQVGLCVLEYWRRKTLWCAFTKALSSAVENTSIIIHNFAQVIWNETDYGVIFFAQPDLPESFAKCCSVCWLAGSSTITRVWCSALLTSFCLNSFGDGVRSIYKILHNSSVCALCTVLCTVQLLHCAVAVEFHLFRSINFSTGW